MRSYQSANHLPIVAGGPYTVTQFNETGTTVLKRNPHFYGPKPETAAIALTYYTNSTSMVLAFEQGEISAIDSVPYDALSAVAGISGAHSVTVPSSTVVPILFNSNPDKKRNRELLNPEVRRAIDLAVNRASLINIVFRGGAVPWGNWISLYSGSWANPAVKPPPFDPSRANAILDALGYRRGANGIRVTSATTGRFAQPAHEMSYAFAVPGDLPFDGSRVEQVVQQGLARIGIAVHEDDIGDTDAAYAFYQGPNGSYQQADIGVWYYSGYADPNYMLGLPTKAQWGNYNDTGYDNPTYDALYNRQAVTVNQATRHAIVWRMEAILAHDLPYAPLVNLNDTFSYEGDWIGLNPALYGYKAFFEQLRAAP